MSPEEVPESWLKKMVPSLSEALAEEVGWLWVGS